MNLDDFAIKIKTYNRQKNVVLVDVTVNETLEIRGFVVRYATTKHSPIYPVWMVTPPSVRGRNKMYFHVVRIKDSALWQKLEEKIIALAKEYTDLS